MTIVQKFYGSIEVEAGDSNKSAINKEQLQAETTARTTAINAEKTARENAINAEAAAREQAIQQVEADMTESLEYRADALEQDINHLESSLAPVATSGNYNHLSYKPTLGSLASKDKIKNADIDNNAAINVSKIEGLKEIEDRLKVGKFRELRLGDFGNYRPTGIAYNAFSGHWVAVGAGGRVSVAQNPSGPWKKVDAGFDGNYIMDVATGGTAFVAVGVDGKAATASTAAVETEWTQKPIGFTETVNAVAYSKDNNLFLAVAAGGKMATIGPNSSAWTIRNSGVESGLGSVAYGDGRWVVGVEDGSLLTSTDANTWTKITTSASSPIMSTVYADGIWVVSTLDGNIYVTDLGSLWEKVNEYSGLFSRHTTYGNGVWVNSGKGNFFYITDNPQGKWTQVLLEKYNNSERFKVYYNSGVWAIITNDSGRVFISYPAL